MHRPLPMRCCIPVYPTRGQPEQTPPESAQGPEKARAHRTSLQNMGPLSRLELYLTAVGLKPQAPKGFTPASSLPDATRVKTPKPDQKSKVRPKLQTPKPDPNSKARPKLQSKDPWNRNGNLLQLPGGPPFPGLGKSQVPALKPSATLRGPRYELQSILWIVGPY